MKNMFNKKALIFAAGLALTAVTCSAQKDTKPLLDTVTHVATRGVMAVFNADYKKMPSNLEIPLAFGILLKFKMGLDADIQLTSENEVSLTGFGLRYLSNFIKALPILDVFFENKLVKVAAVFAVKLLILANNTIGTKSGNVGGGEFCVELPLLASTYFGKAIKAGLAGVVASLIVKMLPKVLAKPFNKYVAQHLQEDANTSLAPTVIQFGLKAVAPKMEAATAKNIANKTIGFLSAFKNIVSPLVSIVSGNMKNIIESQIH